MVINSTKFENSKLIVIFACLLSVFIIIGCGGTGKSIYKIKTGQITDFSQRKKLDYIIELKLNNQLCNLQYYISTGLTYYADIGEVFCYNAKVLAENIFREVIITNSEKNVNSDLILTPEIVKINKAIPIFNKEIVQIKNTTAKYSWDTITMGIYIKWTITDRKGNIKWVDVIEGIGKEKMGGPISYKKNSKKQIRMAMKNMFLNTYNSIFLSSHYLDNDQQTTNVYQFENLNWKIAKTRDSVESYERFLKNYPDGIYAKLARESLDIAIGRGPDSTTRFCQSWSEIKEGMSYDSVQKIMTESQAFENIINIKTRLYKSSNITDVIYKAKHWAMRYTNNILVNKKHDAVCEFWREYYYPFLTIYLK